MPRKLEIDHNLLDLWGYWRFIGKPNPEGWSDETILSRMIQEGAGAAQWDTLVNRLPNLRPGVSQCILDVEKAYLKMWRAHKFQQCSVLEAYYCIRSPQFITMISRIIGHPLSDKVPKAIKEINKHITDR